MGDPSGPGQHRNGDESDDHAPRHLPSASPPGGYDLGYGAHPPGGRNGIAVRTPASTTAPPPLADPAARPFTAPPAPAATGVGAHPAAPTGPPLAAPQAAAAPWSAAEADTGQMPVVPGPLDAARGRAGSGAPPHLRTTAPGGIDPTALEGPLLGPVGPGGFAVGLDRPEVGRRVPVHAREWPDLGGDAPDTAPAHSRHSGDDRTYGYGYGPDDDGPHDDDERRHGVAGSVQGAVAEAAWRYRSAPLRVRIIADLTAASLALLLIVGVAFALRQDDGPEQATADIRPQPTTTASTTTTTLPTTTTTVPPTTTTAPPTTTTTVPPTTTTAAPVVPPPTEAPTTTVPPTTTTTEAVTYRSCRSARSAGALPLHAGQPGYGEHLDSDRDGEACDDFEDWVGRG